MTQDPELLAIERVKKDLEGFDPAAKARIARYVASWAESEQHQARTVAPPPENGK